MTSVFLLLSSCCICSLSCPTWARTTALKLFWLWVSPLTLRCIAATCSSCWDKRVPCADRAAAGFSAPSVSILASEYCRDQAWKQDTVTSFKVKGFISGSETDTSKRQGCGKEAKTVWICDKTLKCTHKDETHWDRKK